MSVRAEIRPTLKLALPIMGAQVLVLSMTFVDNAMVGRLGRDALAGLAIASGFYSFVQVLVIGALGSVSSLIATARGAGRDAHVGVIARQALLVSLMISVVLAAGLAVSDRLLLWAAQDPALVPIATEYLRAMIWAVPCQLGYMVLRQVAEGSESSLPSLAIAGTAAAANIPLDYVLIYGMGPVPALGVAGAGYATAIVSALMVAAMAVHLLTRPHFRRFALLAEGFRPRREVLRELVRAGAPMGAAVGAEMAFFVGSTLLMGTISATALAAHQVALNAASLVFMVPLGLSIALSIRIGRALGAGDPRAARACWLAGIVVTVVSQSLSAALFLAVPEWIVGLYGQTGEVLELACKLLFIAAVFQLFDGLQVVGMGALRGLHEGRYAFLAATGSYWLIGAGIFAWVMASGDPSPEGLWGGLLAGLVAASVLHHWKIHRRTLSSVAELTPDAGPSGIPARSVG